MRKMSFRVVCIALMALFVMGISLSCVDNEVIEPLGQGLYFDGFFGPFIRIIEVDEFGNFYYPYYYVEDFYFAGFAFHDGKATSFYEFVEPGEEAVLQYLDNVKSPLRILQFGYNNLYVLDTDAFTDWSLVYDEWDKYLDKVTLPYDCELGIIPLTIDGEESLPGLVKNVRVVPNICSDETKSDWITVVNNELILKRKYTLAKGFKIDIEVTIASGIAKERIYVELEVLGYDD